MNESTAIIPLAHSTSEAARALVWGAQQLGPAQLARCDARQIRALMRGLYTEARSNGVLRELKAGLAEVGTRGNGNEVIYQAAVNGLRVIATLYPDAGLTVQLEDKFVLDDQIKLGADVLFAPGPWLPGLLDAIEAERWKRTNQAAAAEERAALAIAQQLKAGL